MHERLIGTRVALAHVLGRVGQVELDRATATRLEVDEQQPVLRAEDVPWMWLAVQQLLGRAAVADRLSQVSEGACQELSVRVGERRREVSARNEPLGVRDSIGEMRCRDVERSHPLVQPLEGIRVVGWRDVLQCPGRVVGPERHCEAVTLVDARAPRAARERPRDSRSERAGERGRLRAVALPGLPKRLGQGRRRAADAG